MSHPPMDQTPSDRRRRAQKAAVPEIESLLHRLPREEASPAFTGEVLRRLAARPVSRSKELSRARGVWLGGLAVAAGALLGALLAPFLAEHSSSPAGSSERLAYSPEEVRELRAEYQELQRELQDLQRTLTEAQPVVGLAGDDRVDYILDLGDILGGGSSSPIRPAAFPLRERR